MTGSAFAILSRRGTLYSGWLRRITYINTELREQKGGGRPHPAGGWRIYVGGGFASQDASKNLDFSLVL